MAWKGPYKVQNPSKYKGDPTQVVYRSRPELVYMMRLDSDPDVIEWSSESIIIPYIDPNDNRWHRYFPDFYVKRSDGTTIIQEYKPQTQVDRPAKPRGGITKKFLAEASVWMKNQAKWEAARTYCAKRGWAFEVLSESHLGIDFGWLKKPGPKRQRARPRSRRARR